MAQTNSEAQRCMRHCANATVRKGGTNHVHVVLPFTFTPSSSARHPWTQAPHGACGAWLTVTTPCHPMPVGWWQEIIVLRWARQGVDKCERPSACTWRVNQANVPACASPSAHACSIGPGQGRSFACAGLEGAPRTLTCLDGVANPAGAHVHIHLGMVGRRKRHGKVMRPSLRVDRSNPIAVWFGLFVPIWPRIASGRMHGCRARPHRDHAITWGHMMGETTTTDLAETSNTNTWVGKASLRLSRFCCCPSLAEGTVYLTRRAHMLTRSQSHSPAKRRKAMPPPLASELVTNFPAALPVGGYISRGKQAQKTHQRGGSFSHRQFVIRLGSRSPTPHHACGFVDLSVAILEVDGQDGMERHQQQLVRERGRRIKAAAELGLARSSRGRQWGRALGRRTLVVASEEVTSASSTASKRQTPQKKATSLLDEEEEEVEVVEEKVALLRQLVPGGEDMAVEGLLEETADYIEALKAQVGVMRALACLLAGSGLDALVPEMAAAAGLLTPEKPH
ncbi:hypothetical protein HU200_036637 [Digitaria exilis]|uniref:Uncharacterized protein n=1 Tax=Digitaria exilis TaxID=1010633 RepID=A0A835EL30_9POAL|nr:hypothetical protein HU200_036637 [Digitaria exilis]